MTIVYQHENEVFACDADVPPIPLGNVPTLFSTAVDLRDLETGRTSNISADAVEGRFSLLLFVPPPLSHTSGYGPVSRLCLSIVLVLKACL